MELGPALRHSPLRCWPRLLHLLCWALLGLCMGAEASTAAADVAGSGPTVIGSLRHDLSPPLRTLQPLLPVEAADLQAMPRMALPRSRVDGTATQGTALFSPAVALEGRASPAPEPLITWTGLHNISQVVPPDPVGDVGPHHYVQMVNQTFAIWDKAGDLLYGPANINTLFAGLGGICAVQNDGDPIVLYDQLADRWLMSQFALNFPNDFHQCIAISQTGDPTGAWHRYDFKISDSKMNDYPHFGVWPDGYYMAINQFDGRTQAWAGQGVVVFERDRMLQGVPARMVYFDLFTRDPGLGGMLPADMDGLRLPPSGSPNYFLQIDDDAWDERYLQDQLQIWSFAVDWSEPARSAFSGPQLLTTAPFDPDLCSYRLCIPQPDTAVRLDPISDRVMYRLQYRNFGSYGAMVVNHTVDVNGADQAGIRWYELRTDGEEWTLYQQGTYAPDALHRWMGSMAMDGAGNIALGYSVSSSSLYPSIRYAVRQVDDPLGQLGPEREMVAGGGSQLSTRGRWGDYSMMAVDPVDECTFWYTQEAYRTNSVANWVTYIGAFRLPECLVSNDGTLQGSVKTAAGAPITDALVTADGFAALTDAAGRYRLTHLPTAVYTVSASAYGYVTQQMADVTVQAGLTTTLDLILTALPRTLLTGSVQDGSGAGWPLYARLDFADSVGSVFTDPVTGAYTVELVADQPYTVTVRAESAGYLSLQQVVNGAAPTARLDFALLVDATACTAPGYERTAVQGLYAAFDHGLPEGWSVVDHAGSGQVWQISAAGAAQNSTGGVGGFALVESDRYGEEGRQDTELRTPVLDLSDLVRVDLAFATDYQTYYGADIASVDLSVDGGEQWISVWRRSGENLAGPAHVAVDVTALAAGQAAVVVRFHYGHARDEWWWQVDNVLVGQATCQASGGGLVVGTVRDDNTGAALNGVQVQAEGGGHAQSMATPADAALADGFYLLAAPAGEGRLIVDEPPYGRLVQELLVEANAVVGQDLALPAGLLQALPGSLGLSLPYGSPAVTHTVTLSNSGQMTATFQIALVDGGDAPPQARAAYAARKRKFSLKRLDDPTAVRVYVGPPAEVATWPGGELWRQWAVDGEGVWGLAYQPETGQLWIGSGVGRAVPHRLDGTLAGPGLGPLMALHPFSADMAYDPITRRLWQVAAGGEGCIVGVAVSALHTAAHATPLQICPPFPVPQRGLAYDPLSDTFLSGSWNNEILYRFDRQGRILDAVHLGLAIAGLAYNPATDRLFVLASGAVGPDVYVVDVSHEFRLEGGFEIPGMGEWAQAGLTLDCAGGLWAANQATGHVVQVSAGEAEGEWAGACAWAAPDWLAVTPAEGQVPAQGVGQVELRFDAEGLLPGQRSARLQIDSDTPYGPISLPVTLTLTHGYAVSVTSAVPAASGLPGTQVSYSVQIVNRSTITETFDTALTGNRWTTQAPLGVGPLAVGQSQQLPVQVQIPATALHQEQDQALLTVRARSDPSVAVQVTLTTTANQYAVRLELLSDGKQGDPGSDVSHLVALQNWGVATDQFNLSVTEASWPTVVPTMVGPLAAGAATFLSAIVSIPEDALPFATEIVTLTAASAGDPAQRQSVQLVTQAAPRRGLAVSPALQQRTAPPGTEVVYSLQITNTGNYSDAFGVEVLDAAWPVAVPARVGPLAAQSGTAITVTVSLPELAVGELQDWAQLRIVSEGDPRRVGSASLLTRAAVDRLYLPAVSAERKSSAARVGQRVSRHSRRLHHPAAVVAQQPGG